MNVMLSLRISRAALFGLLVAMGSQIAYAAEGRVELELYGESGGSALVFQQWAQALGKAGIRHVRIQSGKSATAGVEVRGTTNSPLYVVTGIIRGRDDLVLSSGRFKQRDAGRIARWLDDLAKNGPESDRPKKAAFGLSAKQFEEVYEDMAQPLGFKTQGVTRRRVAEQIARRLKIPVRWQPGTLEAIGEEKVAEELSSLSCGTTLAYVLRPAGLCVVPSVVGGRVEYSVTKSRRDLEIWPIGWASKKLLSQTAPTLAEFHNISIQRASAEAALGAIGKQVKIPLLLDRSAMARHGIDPAEVVVSYPRKRTTYMSALRQILFQARLKFEVRLDEADNPLLWISTIKPVE